MARSASGCTAPAGGACELQARRLDTPAFPHEAGQEIDDGLAARLLPFGAMLFVRLLWPGWMSDWVIGIERKEQPRYLRRALVQETLH